MTGSGQSRHFDRAPITSDLPPAADMIRTRWHVSKGPIVLKKSKMLPRQNSRKSLPGLISSEDAFVMQSRKSLIDFVRVGVVHRV
jgi:hypothetical protein